MSGVKQVTGSRASSDAGVEARRRSTFAGFPCRTATKTSFVCASTSATRASVSRATAAAAAGAQKRRATANGVCCDDRRNTCVSEAGRMLRNTNEVACGQHAPARWKPTARTGVRRREAECTRPQPRWYKPSAARCSQTCWICLALRQPRAWSRLCLPVSPATTTQSKPGLLRQRPAAACRLSHPLRLRAPRALRPEGFVAQRRRLASPPQTRHTEQRQTKKGQRRQRHCRPARGEESPAWA